MSALKASIQDVLNMQSRPQGFARPFSTVPAINEAYETARSILGDAKAISGPDAHESEYWIAKAKLSFSRQTMMADFTSADMKNISRCLWYGSAPLAGDSHFLGAFLHICDQKLRRSLCHILIWAYLANYEAERTGIALLGTWLSHAVMKWDWLWADRQKSLQLFNGGRAPYFIRMTIQESTQTIVHVLSQCGLKGNLATSGVGVAAFDSMISEYRKVASMSNGQGTLACLNRLLEWSCREEGLYSFPKSRVAFIDALLSPWNTQAPSADVKTITQSFLVENFKDPRLGGLGWHNVSETSQQVIRRWLVERALEQFLDVVDGLAVDNQWKYRRAFWMAYYKRKAISDAWVGFASSGAMEARQIAKRNNDNSWLSFANLTGSGDPRHAALILKIGDLTIVDFSHNGKWRIWDATNRLAPRPYAAAYDRDLIKQSGANSEGIHSNSDRGTWQNALALEIATHTGISLTAKDYMP